MSGVSKSLCDVAPLHGEVAVVIERSHLVDAPRERAVVENDVLAIASPCGISAVVHILHLRASAADEAHDNIVTLAEIQGIVAQCDTVARGSLSGYSCI